MRATKRPAKGDVDELVISGLENGGSMLETVVYQGLSGLSYAMDLWLIAAGLAIVFGTLQLLNFAHGAFYMIGAYLALTFYGMLGLNFWLAIALSIISTALLGAIIERFFFRPIYDLELPYQLILTYAFVLIFDDMAKLIWGPRFSVPPTPGLLNGTILIFGRGFSSYKLFLIGVGIGTAIFVWLVLEKTWWGKTIRASVSHREMASVIGINVPLLFTIVFMFGIALAALGGALSIPTKAVTPGLGSLVIVQAFVVTVIGGLGNLKGTFIGALIIGLLTSYCTLFMPFFEMFVMYAVMAIVLIFRPQGLFGG